MDGRRLRLRVDRTAQYEKEHCRRRSECRLWVSVLPCDAQAIGLVRPGCWARALSGCASPSSQHNAPFWPRLKANWTRRRGGLSDRMICLINESAVLNAACQPANAHRQIDVVYVGRFGHRRTCAASQPALKFQIPRRGACFSAGSEPAPRYRTNHGHQAEVLVPMIEESAILGWAPELVHWGWELSHWVRSLFPALLPYTRLLRGKKPSPKCRTFPPLGSHGGRRRWFRRPSTAGRMR